MLQSIAGMTSLFGSPPEPPDDKSAASSTESQDDAANARSAVREDDLWAHDDDEASDGFGVSSTNAAAENAPVFDSDVATQVVDADSVDERDLPGAAGRRLRRVTWEILQTLVLAGLIFLLVRGVAQNFRVEGPSMEPGLQNGQYLLVNKAVYFKLDFKTLSKYVPFISGGSDPSKYLFHSPERGDVIVFRYPKDPSRDFIKRVIGVPGDTISITDGAVSVNGVVLSEPYITFPSKTDMEPLVVPPHSYFVMGDNRANSSDSRAWGFVPDDNIIGKAMFSYWPLSDFGGVGNTSFNIAAIHISVPHIALPHLALP